MDYLQSRDRKIWKRSDETGQVLIPGFFSRRDPLRSDGSRIVNQLSSLGSMENYATGTGNCTKISRGDEC